MTFHIQPLSNRNDLDELRFIVKGMARKLSMRPTLPPGRPGMRTVTNKVLDGTVTYYELNRWYPKAVELLRKGI